MESDNELEIENEGGQEAEASQAAPGPETSQGKGARKKAKEPAKKKEDPCIYCGKNCVKGCVLPLEPYVLHRLVKRSN